MKIFLDTNILLDVLVKENRPNYEYSRKIMDAARTTSDLAAYISVQSISDCAYYYTKKGKTDVIKYILPLRNILSFIRLRTTLEQSAYDALAGTFPDLEDEMQLRCAIDAECAYFITGDREILDHQPFKLIKAIHPAEFLAIAARQPH